MVRLGWFSTFTCAVWSKAWPGHLAVLRSWLYCIWMWGELIFHQNVPYVGLWWRFHFDNVEPFQLTLFTQLCTFSTSCTLYFAFGSKHMGTVVRVHRLVSDRFDTCLYYLGVSPTMRSSFEFSFSWTITFTCMFKSTISVGLMQELNFLFLESCNTLIVLLERSHFRQVLAWGKWACIWHENVYLYSLWRIPSHKVPRSAVAQ